MNLINLSIVLVSVANIVIGTSVAAQDVTDEERDRAIRQQIEKSRKEDEKTRHKKVQSRLIGLEDAYKKEGEEGARKYADGKRDVKIKDGRVTVKILVDPEQATSDIESVLASYGCIISMRIDSRIAADVPINRIREIADNVPAILRIELPRLLVPLVESEGVGITGARSYLASE